MFVLCKTHHYLWNEEANSVWKRVLDQQLAGGNATGGELERSPAAGGAAGFPLVGWTAGGQGRPVIGRFEATKARQQPTTPQGNKVVGGCQSVHWGHTQLFIIIIFIIVLTSFHI